MKSQMSTTRRAICLATLCWLLVGIAVTAPAAAAPTRVPGRRHAARR